jgi:hypothetical protein
MYMPVSDSVKKNLQASMSSRLLLLALIPLLAGALSCASVPEYPSSTPPISKILPVNEKEAFQLVREVLMEDPRLELHTVDTGGRLVAREKTSGFIFWQHRTILDFLLQPAGDNQTKITMILKAEQYESGGLTRPAGWYASPDIDAFLGEDILGLIEKRVRETAKE